MDPATAAVMILLSCSPDMLFCRAAEPQPRAYASVLACEQALRNRLAGERHADSAIVGRCQIVSEPANAASWKITPDRRLITFEGPQTTVSQRSADLAPTAPIELAQALEPVTPDGYATVRVTRGTGADATTTSYRVPRAE